MFRFTGNKEWSRVMRASICLFWGRWGLPLPYKHDIISLVGQPVTGAPCPVERLSLQIWHQSCFLPG